MSNNIDRANAVLARLGSTKRIENDGHMLEDLLTMIEAIAARFDLLERKAVMGVSDEEWKQMQHRALASAMANAPTQPQS